MKRISLVAAFCLLLANLLNAQVKNQITTAKIDEIIAGMRNTTYVVLFDPKQTEVNVQYEKIVADTVVEKGDKNNTIVDENPYNIAIKDAMKLWKLGKVEYITQEEFNTKRLDPASSFIFPLKVKEELFGQKIESLYLVYGVGSKKGTKADRVPRIAAVPVTYFNIGPEYYTFKLGGLIQFLQGHAAYVADIPETTDEEILRHYNSKARMVKDYTLYVLQEDLTSKVYTTDQIAALYDGEVQIVDGDELKELIAKKTEGAAFLHKSGPERTKKEDALCRKFIIVMKDGECIYASEDQIKKNAPEGLLEADFKKFKK